MIFDRDESGAVLAVAGTKEDLDLAMLWARASLVSAFGEVEGLKALKAMPAAVGLVLWQHALMSAPDA